MKTKKQIYVDNFDFVAVNLTLWLYCLVETEILGEGRVVTS